jgi:hypothetical protein
VEDFEFKPLTDGLGFHGTAGGSKRAENTNASASSFSKASQSQSTGSTRSESQRSSMKTAPMVGGIPELLSDDEDTRPLSKSITDMIASLPPSLDFIDEQIVNKKSSSDLEKNPRERVTDIEVKLPPSDGPRPQIFQPFAREDFKAGASLLSTGPTVGSALGAKIFTSSPSAHSSASVAAPVSSPYRERLDESFARAFPHAERRPETKPDSRGESRTAVREAKAIAKRLQLEAGGVETVPSHFGAGFIDAMIVTGVSTILLVAIILITHINFWGLLSNAQTDHPTQLHIALLFISVMQLYLLTARSFFGASLGEWAFDLQLGTREDQQTTVYPLLVAWRTLVITLTGIVVLPVISLLIGRDLARHVTGLQLYRRL